MKVSGKQKNIQVLFPCVHGLAMGQMVTINAFPSFEMKSTIKVVNGVEEEIAGRIVGASRYGESDSRTGIGVIALFSNPLFTGQSYGLALAVADKLARFDSVRDWTIIYATGIIPADGCGRVDAIGGFAQKLETLIQAAKPGSLFLYPKKNHIPSDQIKGKLEALKGKGVACIAIAAIDDLNGRIWKSCAAMNYPDRKSLAEVTAETGTHVFNKLHAKVVSLPAKIWKIAVGIVLAGICCLLVYVVLNSFMAKQMAQDIQKNNILVKVEKTNSRQDIKQKKQTNVKNINNASQQTQNMPNKKPEQKSRKEDNPGKLIGCGSFRLTQNSAYYR